MLETACIYQSAFEKYEEDESTFTSDLGVNIPDGYDWLMVKKFSECLSYFYFSTLCISGCLYVTLNMHFSKICDLHLTQN